MSETTIDARIKFGPSELVQQPIDFSVVTRPGHGPWDSRLFVGNTGFKLLIDKRRTAATSEFTPELQPHYDKAKAPFFGYVYAAAIYHLWSYFQTQDLSGHAYLDHVQCVTNRKMAIFIHQLFSRSSENDLVATTHKFRGGDKQLRLDLLRLVHLPESDPLIYFCHQAGENIKNSRIRVQHA